MSILRIALSLEFSVMFAGLILLWQLVLSPAARARTITSPIPKWDAPVVSFLILIWLVIAGGILGQCVSVWLLKGFGPVTSNTRIIAASAGFQAGMLAGCIFFRWTPSLRAHAAPNWTPKPVSFLLSGLVTFLIALPLVMLTSVAWRYSLERLGYPTPPQEPFDLFVHAKKAAPLLTLMAVATVIAPVSEELIFRAGIFRYLRERVPRWAALLVPALLFAALHDDRASFLPLAVLGVVFALAYETTGSIAVPIVAHSLFNLNSIVLLFAGVDK